uniref:ciliary microtubule inner protein 2B n=1 Tax=Semicossyphus pulcher TaxID=241346 RepID=UPI0037E7B905
MEKYAPNLSKVMLTPDPHYTPGFAGHCPQLKYNVGKSYARLKSELLSSPEVKRSGRLVLQDAHVPSAEHDSALTLRMIAGYTGFIPKSQNYIASSYSDTCRKAMSEFNKERQEKIQQRSSDLPVVVNYTKQQFERPRPPFTAISDIIFTYKPLKPFTPLGKPYLMDDDDPNKYFISGFMGHVPKSRFLEIGKGYPIITKQALNLFGQQQRSDPTSLNVTERKDGATTASPSNRGVVPYFTGHIPGFKFMHGQTFGQLSQNALEKSGIKRSLPDKSENLQ